MKFLIISLVLYAIFAALKSLFEGNNSTSTKTPINNKINPPAKLIIPEVVRNFQRKYYEEKLLLEIKKLQTNSVYFPQAPRFQRKPLYPQLPSTFSDNTLLDEIDSICFTCTKNNLLTPIFEKAKSTPHLEAAPPAIPSPPNQPVKPSLLDEAITDITFDPPDHSANTDELPRFQDAKDKRSRLIETIKETNIKLLNAYETAIQDWEAAVQNHNKNKIIFLEEYKKSKNEYEEWCKTDQEKFLDIEKQYHSKLTAGVLAYYDLLLNSIYLPKYIPRKWETQYIPESRIFILEHQFPNILNLKILKKVSLKTGTKTTSANIKECKTFIAKIQPALCLRLAYEIANHDSMNTIDAIVINGKVDFCDKATGQDKIVYCASLFVLKEDILKIDLQKIDPVIAFKTLKGSNTGTIYDITPVNPILHLNTDDKRFIAPREILNHLQNETNLAVMEWDDFEHLIRELFEKEFFEDGSEVKVTQASRDQGVDAVVFHPDPLRGGKIIIQAKRYTGMVQLSAIRDLYGTVINEGANKGILVTTSNFGSESYNFVKDKPITLINGAELLGLLKKHGYNFRINLEEAKRLAGMQ